jgi:histidinol-phosphate aminotransferase
MQHDLSRRHFAALLGAGAAVAAFPPVLARNAPGAPVLLNANENPYGPSPAAMRAIRDSLGELFRYPDEARDVLVATIAKMHGVTSSEVLLGNGSSDILRLAAFAFPGKLVTANPTFEALWNHARDREVVKVPLDAAYAHDLDKMLEASRDAGLVYVCNPNNPTATITPKAALRAFLDAVPSSTAVLVDEAYFHYAESPDYESVAPLIATKPNLIVARTFSKIYGMAGMRCGYALAQHATIEKLEAQQAWDPINLLAAVAANASLNDAAYAVASRKRNHDVRAHVVAELERLGYHALPSEANFMMIDMREDVKPLIAKFREQGVRPGRLFPPMPQHLRVTIGTPEEMGRFVDVFRAIVRGE